MACFIVKTDVPTRVQLPATLRAVKCVSVWALSTTIFRQPCTTVPRVRTPCVAVTSMPLILWSRNLSSSVSWYRRIVFKSRTGCARCVFVQTICTGDGSQVLNMQMNAIYRLRSQRKINEIALKLFRYAWSFNEVRTCLTLNWE